jgi:tetratricopeptide (TPR) repeat protein
MEPTLNPGHLDPAPLATLAHHLQNQLQQEHTTQFETLQLQTVPLRIHCVLKGMTLMVLGQHPVDQSPVPGQVFATLERAVRTLPPELMASVFDPQLLPCQIQVKLYLRSRGQQQPHALHAFTFVPVFISSPGFISSLVESAPATSPADDVDSSQDLDRLDPHSDLTHSDPDLSPFSAHPPNVADFGTVADRPEAAPLDPSPDLDPLDLDLSDPDLNDPEALPADTGLDAETESDRVAATPQAMPSTGFSYQSEDQAAPIPWLIIGLVGGCAAILSSAFVLTRPCMLDACQPLQTARRLSQECIQTAAAVQSPEDLKRVQAKLADINRQLDQVPRWSGRFTDAQALRQQSQTQTTHLDAILAALDQAAQANDQSTGSGATAANNAKVQALWQAAIAQLSTIPDSSPLYDFAQAKLTEFQDNLATVNRQSLSRGQASQKLAAAKATAQKAQDRQKTAQTQEEWQLTKSTWLTAIKALQEIPPTAHNYAEAQPLLPTYQAQVTIAGDRLAQIQQSRQAYTQTLAIADRARTLEQQRQWTAAVAAWREALQRAQQIPANAPDAAQVQTLIPAYGAALKQAEGQLQSVIAQQRIQTDLEKVCAGTPKICGFTIAPELIRLQLTSTYEQDLGNAFAIGQSTPSTYGQTVVHINTLQTALQTICNNAGTPLEVYNAKGSELVGSFNPQR